MIDILNFLFKEACYKGICPILTDNNSNYIGYFYTGPLKGKICFINHEETDLSPGFRSVNNLIQEILSKPDCEWLELSLDYPEEARNDLNLHEDLETIELIKKNIADNKINDDYRQQLMYALISITPFSCTEDLYKYLKSDDMYIQEKAVNVIRKRRYKKAADKLFDIAKNGMHNGKISAICALKEINTKETSDMLKELERILPKGYQPYFRR